ncbi:Fc.00g107610.m01.CDS01 [Cosmosporella sp. VM-42]
MQRIAGPAAFAALIPFVAGHGFVLDPPAREPGSAYKAACGEQPFNQQSADINGNVQGILQVVGTDFDASACNLWLCKGFLLEDNPDNVQSFSLGEKIDFSVKIAAPHTGYANVSVVKTRSNSIIGEPLIEFSNYASNNGVDANNTAFSVTLPDTLGGACASAGDCVLQWFWDAPDIDQTYEACVDFTVGGSSSGGTTTSPAASESSAAVTSTAEDITASATSAPVTSAAVSVTASDLLAPTSDAAEPTTTAGDECPADDEDDDDGEEGPGDDEDDTDGGDDDCPADEGDGKSDEDDGEDDSEDDGEDGEDCPADGENGGDSDATTEPIHVSTPAAASVSAAEPTSTTLPTDSGAGSGSGSGSASDDDAGSQGASTTIITSYVTVIAQPTYITITAEATACI